MTIDPNQILIGLSGADFTVEHLANCRAVRRLDVIREATTVVVDDKYFHEQPFGSVKEGKKRVRKETA